MDAGTDIRNKAIAIINNYMGETTAKLYKDFYQKQNEKTVLISIKTLLIEYMGEEPAKTILDKNGILT